MSAVAMIVSDPPSSMPSRRAEEPLRLLQRVAVRPPDRILPAGITVGARARRVIESSRMSTSFLCSTRRFAFSITISATCNVALRRFVERRRDHFAFTDRCSRR
jgi:hypothetical protein